MAEQATLTKIEQIKAEKDGLDVGPDIARYASEGWESIPEDDRDTRLKWWGIFYRKQTTGHFMIRIRIPNGVANAEQVRAIGVISNRYGRGTLDLTTRQQVQLRWIKIEDVPAVMEILRECGLVTLQTGLDNVRGIVGCAAAGLTQNELLDASSVVSEFNSKLVGNREFTNLPRKFNVGITGCLENCTHAETQDVALVPATREIDGRIVSGFNVLLGGKMGSGGYTVAQPLNAFVTPEEAADVVSAITLIFRDHGSRTTRSRARLAFLLEDWGIERFRAEVETRIGLSLTPAGSDQRLSTSTDHIGIFAQRLPGLNYAGLLVPVGRSDGSQLIELARLAEFYGSGSIRFTTNQNVIISDIPDSKLEAFKQEPLLAQLRYDPSEIARGTVSCTGIDYCSLALIESKGHARDLIHAIETNNPETKPVTVNWSGCPAGCGNHQAADIGLMGRKTRIGDEIIDTVDIYVGGSSGPGAQPGIKFMDSVPCAEASRMIEFLLMEIDIKKLRRQLAERADTTSPAVQA